MKNESEITEVCAPGTAENKSNMLVGDIIKLRVSQL